MIPRLVLALCLAVLPASGQCLASEAVSLTAASEQGDTAAMAAAQARGESVESRNGEGWTPLVCAAHAGKIEAVRRLLSWHADPNDLTLSGCSPLDFALEGGHDDIVPLLLDAKADPNGFRGAEGSPSWSPLFRALLHHKPGLAALLLAHGARIDDRNHNGDTALMRASRLPYVDQIRLLIAHGANVNAHRPTGQTALIFAAYTGCDEVARVLLENGADLQAVARDSPTDKPFGALEVATEQGRPYVLEVLADAGAKPANAKNELNEELNDALDTGDFERAQAALAKGASATQPDSHDVLPITVAVLKGDPGIVQLLIKAGADVNASPDGDPRSAPTALVQGQITRAKTPQEKEQFQRVAELLRKAGAGR